MTDRLISRSLPLFWLILSMNRIILYLQELNSMVQVTFAHCSGTVAVKFFLYQLNLNGKSSIMFLTFSISRYCEKIHSAQTSKVPKLSKNCEKKCPVMNNLFLSCIKCRAYGMHSMDHPFF